MTVDEIDRMCRHLGKDLMLIALTGGEPFLREDLVDIVASYYRHTRAPILQITTSGMFRHRVLDHLEAILKLDHRRRVVVNCSIDGLAHRHDEIRGVPGLFEQATHLCHDLQRLQQSHPALTPSVCITMSKYNQDHMIDLIDYLVRQVGVRCIALTLARGQTYIPEASDVDPARYEKVASYLQKLLCRQDIPGYAGWVTGCLVNAQNIIARKRIVRTVREGCYVGRCYAGRLAGVIRSDGEVFACEQVDQSLGNVCRESFEAIWRSPCAQSLRRRLRRCYCTHECFMLVNILYNPLYTPLVAREAATIAARRLLKRASGCLRTISMRRSSGGSMRGTSE